MRKNVNLNLDTLKREILDYLESSEFAVFHSFPGGLEGQRVAPWDSRSYPDYRAFLEVARKAGVKVVMFASSEFAESDIDELEEQIDDADMSREDQRVFKSRLHDFRVHAGSTCSIELAFDLGSRLYMYSMRPDWYNEFLDLEDEIMVEIPGGDEDDDESMGGYYSRN